MKQKITLTHPIPSAIVSELKYNNGNWKYIYYVDTPEEMNDEPKDLIVYGHISTLRVEYDDMIKLSNNIHFKTLNDYMKILQSQYDADINYRIMWYGKSDKKPINTKVLENRDYDNEELSGILRYIATDLIHNDKKTVFAAIY